MDNQMEIALAAEASQLTVVRVVVATIGARLDIDLDRLDDLLLAVEELCVALIEGGSSDDRLRVSLEWDDVDLVARCTLERRAPGAPGAPSDVRSALSAQILDALVDEHGASDDGAAATRWLRFRRVPAPT